MNLRKHLWSTWMTGSICYYIREFRSQLRTQNFVAWWFFCFFYSLE